MREIKRIELAFAGAIAGAVKTATGSAIAVEVTLINREEFSVLCAGVSELNDATKFLSCVDTFTLESIELDAAIGAIAFYRFK
ncbi:hypothetical protein [Burkholderia vietnamiensis]|uniref:hypothetical protein n=1 Tax=Burkholderia vietnamiensis TaxID=60552 RepID=UPI00264CCEB1|nr:hypothetical protein [Burkholderia vietnamiensis]MDN8037451.1 hypothetical protein [Burkholderia vietnamiensis]